MMSPLVDHLRPLGWEIAASGAGAAPWAPMLTVNLDSSDRRVPPVGIDDLPMRLACCRELLFIWERWTNGSPVLRRMLTCGSADPRSYLALRQVLVGALGKLLIGGKDHAPVAAALAGYLTLDLLKEGAMTTIQERMERVWEANLAAEREHSDAP